MPSDPLLNFAELTAPIPGDNPAGDKKHFVPVRDLLEASRTGKDAAGGAPPDPDAKLEPNWTKLINDAKVALAEKCKHVYVAVLLAEGLMMQHGFAGVRDGFKLLRLLFEECWDRMLPPIEEPGDEEVRVGNVNSLGNETSKPYYPLKVRMTPLFYHNGEPQSWQNWKAGDASFAAASRGATRDECQRMIDEITAARDEVTALDRVCGERVPNFPASLTELTQALDDCLSLVKSSMPSASLESTEAGGLPGAPGGGGSGSSGPLGRNEIYKQVEKLAAELNKLEPHSPVPMLLRRACTLGPMNFHELVTELNKDEKPIDFLKPPPEPEVSSEN